MEAAQYRVSVGNVQYRLGSLQKIEIVNGRELDHPCYNGRYCVSANNSGHSGTSNDLRQELQLTTAVCKGFFEHPADFEMLD